MFIFTVIETRIICLALAFIMSEKKLVLTFAVSTGCDVILLTYQKEYGSPKFLSIEKSINVDREEDTCPMELKLQIYVA